MHKNNNNEQNKTDVTKDIDGARNSLLPNIHSD